jgi:hypothetical protein
MKKAWKGSKITKMINDKTHKSIIICALARDCSAALQHNIPRIEDLRSNFKSSDVVVIENDSKDNTKQILLDWSRKSSGVNLIMEDHHTDTLIQRDELNPSPGTSTGRIEKMSQYRNQYLNWIELSKIEPDYILILDIDVISFSVKGVIDTLESAPENWGGLFAYGYTDQKLAGKTIHKIFHDLYAFVERKPVAGTYLTHAEMFRNSKKLTQLIRLNKFYPVISAFGGLGLYKYEAIKGLHYVALKNEDPIMEAVCEHIPFNIDVIDRGYKNYIAREMTVYYGKSNKLMILRNILPLPLFKLLAFMVTFRWLKA